MSDTKESFDNLEAALNAFGQRDFATASFQKIAPPFLIDNIDWRPLDNIQRKWAIMSGFQKDLSGYFDHSTEIH